MNLDDLDAATGPLRPAIAKLYAALNADYLTDGPWDCLDLGDRLVHIEVSTGAVEHVVDEPMSNASNAEYIALMHPPVAEALAALLERIARAAELGRPCPPSVDYRARQLARAILRGAPSGEAGERSDKTNQSVDLPEVTG